MDDHHAALVQLRAYLSQGDKAPNRRLPAERELATLVGKSRGELRKALAVLEAEGLIWRHVGKGTFVALGKPFETYNLAEIARRSNPREVMLARLTFEPAIAAEAAINASPIDLNDLKSCAIDSRNAQTWREYEACDNRFHKLIADSTHNRITSAVFDVLSGIRRAVVWGRLREDRDRPPAGHHSFEEHDCIIAALADRDPAAASAAMPTYLGSVERKLFFEPPGTGIAPKPVTNPTNRHGLVNGGTMSNPENLALDILDCYRLLSTSTVSDALEKLGLVGAVEGLAPLDAASDIVDQATVAYLPAGCEGGHGGGFSRRSGARRRDRNRQSSARMDCTVWGNIMTEMMKNRGIEGTVIDGVNRDLKESREYALPICSRRGHMQTGRDRVTRQASGADLPRRSTARVDPGDLIRADGNDVVIVSLAHAVRVLITAEAIEVKENAILAEIRNGSPLGKAQELQCFNALQTPNA